MKATKKLKTTVEGVTLELTVKEATRLRDMLNELGPDGTGRIMGDEFTDQDELREFGLDLFNTIYKELA